MKSSHFDSYSHIIRYNLIIWCRSSSIRNIMCPMCNEKPKLIPVTDGFGDGFIEYTENVCSAS